MDDVTNPSLAHTKAPEGIGQNKAAYIFVHKGDRQGAQCELFRSNLDVVL